MEPLPPSRDEYWKHAKTYVNELPKVKKCKHEFIHKTSTEVECKHCGVGYFLAPEWHIKDGRVYFKDQLII